MDAAYNAHAVRRKNRSSTNLNHLTLAPLTVKLPLNDPDADYAHDYSVDPLSSTPITTSYLEGKSAPTTPRLLSRSPGPSSRSHSHVRGASNGGSGVSPLSLQKSKSTTHLAPKGHRNPHTTSSGLLSPTFITPHHHRRRTTRDESSTLYSSIVQDRMGTDNDWLLRAGALISVETRESKGQAWLVSRASSTSLAGLRDAEEEAYERELAREREMNSRQASRRGSLVPTGMDDDMTPPPHSRFASRSHSRSQIGALTPGERGEIMGMRSLDGYFPQQQQQDADVALAAGPDFVNLDEALEASGYKEDILYEDAIVEDEVTVRRLVKRGHAGVGSWFGNVLGFRLFSVEENEEETDGDDDDDDDDAEGDEADSHGADNETDVEDDMARERRRSSVRQFEGVTNFVEERMPPPKEGEAGSWQDAAWLLSVATKVLL